MTDKQLTTRLFQLLTQVRPVTISGKVPTIDDVRALIANVRESWKSKQDTTAKAVSST